MGGLEAVIQMVQESGAKLERDFAWDQAGTSYRWLFDIGSLSGPKTHVCVKSTAILWRFQQRLPMSDSPLSDNNRKDLLKMEYFETQEKLDQQKQRHPKLQRKLKSFFNLHRELESVNNNFSPEFRRFQQELYEELPQSFERRTIYETYQRAGDIFDRTEHVMESNFIDHARSTGAEIKFRGSPGQEDLRMNLSIYIEQIAEPVKVVKELKRYPMRLLDGLYSAIFLPTQTFSQLLENGVDVNCRDLDHLTPLHYGCRSEVPGGDYYPDSYYERRDEKQIEALLLNKADINSQDLRGNTPLHLAVLSNRRFLVEVLIERGCNVQISNFEGRAPLHLAAMLEDTDILSLLLSAKAEINVQDQAGQTPLHVATTVKNSKSIKKLIGSGAKQDITDKANRTAVLIAASLDILPAFENHYEKASLASSILQAAKTGEIEAIGRLMEKMDRDSWPPTDDSNKTPFHLAARYKLGRPEVTVMMIRKAKELEFNPEGILKPENEDTALSIAATYGALDLVKGIMENLEPDIRKKLLEQAGNTGMTPLHWTADSRERNVFSYLVDQGANMRTRTKENKNLLHLATSSSSHMMRHVIKKIKEKVGSSDLQAMLQEKDEKNRTPRETAEWLGNSENVMLLDKEIKKHKVPRGQSETPTN
ncbi:hypothetical protein IL306_000314 [Fusarium sp. DS 682]|nr:hypothetical protein IL306_000314 [Fusarium sp. DS 682]